MAKIEIYTTGFCPYCQRAKMLLDSKGVDYQEYRVDKEPGLRATMTDRANGGYTVPQIFVNDQHLGGCDDVMALEAQGKFDPLIAA